MQQNFLKEYRNKDLVLGIDADLTKIGIALVNVYTGEPVLTKKITPSKKDMMGMERAIDLRSQVSRIVKKYEEDIVFAGLEDFGHNQQLRKNAEKGQLIGLLRYLLYIKKITYLQLLTIKKTRKRTNRYETLIIPTQLTKFIFGQGNISSSGKSSRLMLEVYQKTGYEFKSDDECDAFMMCQALRVFIICKLNRIVKYEKGMELELWCGGVLNNLKLTANTFDPISKWLDQYNGKKFWR